MPTSYDHLPAAAQAALERDLTIDITTIGRTSSLPRRIEIWFLNIDGTIYITGTPGRRDWFANLAANPTFTFHLKQSTHADLMAHATIVADRDERDLVLRAAASQWYRDQTTIEELVDAAPMVRIDFAV